MLLGIQSHLSTWNLWFFANHEASSATSQITSLGKRRFSQGIMLIVKNLKKNYFWSFYLCVCFPVVSWRNIVFFNIKSCCNGKISWSILFRNVPGLKYLFKLAVTDPHQKYPLAIMLLKCTLATPVSEAICESLGSIIASVMFKRPGANDTFNPVK